MPRMQERSSRLETKKNTPMKIITLIKNKRARCGSVRGQLLTIVIQRRKIYVTGRNCEGGSISGGRGPTIQTRAVHRTKNA
jgi:hypothetical protein